MFEDGKQFNTFHAISGCMVARFKKGTAPVGAAKNWIKIVRGAWSELSKSPGCPDYRQT